jgi:hypothetical protein
VDHLLIGRRRRKRPAPGVVEEELDRGAVDDVERDDVAAPVATDLQRRRVTSPVNVGVRALLVDLLILSAVEVDLAWGQQPTVAVVAAVKNDHGVAIAIPVTEQMASSIAAAFSDQQPAAGGAAIPNVTD